MAILILFLLGGGDPNPAQVAPSAQKLAYFDLHTGLFRDLSLGLTIDFSGGKGAVHPQFSLEYADGFGSKSFYVLPKVQIDLAERWFVNLGAGWYDQTIAPRRRFISGQELPEENRHGAALELSTGFRSKSQTFHLTFGLVIKEKEGDWDAKPLVLWGWRF